MKRIDLLEMSSGELIRHFVFDGRERFEKIATRENDGIAIPPGTRVRLIIVLEHKPENERIKRMFDKVEV